MRERSKERQRETARQRGVKRDRETEVKGDRDRGQERETREERERGWWLVVVWLRPFAPWNKATPLLLHPVFTQELVFGRRRKRRRRKGEGN